MAQPAQRLQHTAAPITAECHKLLQRLRWQGDGRIVVDGAQPADAAAPAPLRTLGLTSSVPGEGVSTLAMGLARCAAELDRGPVLLVDANWRHPSVHRAFQIELAPGLAEALRDPDALDLATKGSGIDRLELLPAGVLQGDAPMVCDQHSVTCVTDALALRFALVVVDLPPASSSVLSPQLVALLDALVLVVEAERVGGEAVRSAQRRLLEQGAQLCGAVLNKKREYVPWWIRRSRRVP